MNGKTRYLSGTVWPMVSRGGGAVALRHVFVNRAVDLDGVWVGALGGEALRVYRVTVGRVECELESPEWSDFDGKAAQWVRLKTPVHCPVGVRVVVSIENTGDVDVENVVCNVEGNESHG